MVFAALLAAAEGFSSVGPAVTGLKPRQRTHGRIACYSVQSHQPSDGKSPKEENVVDVGFEVLDRDGNVKASTIDDKAPQKPGGLFSFLAPANEEPEPPRPKEESLRQISDFFGALRWFGVSVILLSLGLDLAAKKYETAAKVSAVIRKNLWSIYAAGAVWEVLHKETKRDNLQKFSCKVLNVALCLTALHLVVVKTGVPFAVAYLVALPSALALRRSGLPKLGLGGGSDAGKSKYATPLDGPLLSVLYATLAWEAVLSGFKSPMQLPFLRGAVLWLLYRAVRHDEAKLGTPKYARLNDALFYSSFCLFPEGFMANPTMSSALMIPIVTLMASVQGKTMAQVAAKEREEQAAAGAGAK